MGRSEHHPRGDQHGGEHSHHHGGHGEGGQAAQVETINFEFGGEGDDVIDIGKLAFEIEHHRGGEIINIINDGAGEIDFNLDDLFAMLGQTCDSETFNFINNGTGNIDIDGDDLLADGWLGGNLGLSLVNNGNGGILVPVDPEDELAGVSGRSDGGWGRQGGQRGWQHDFDEGEHHHGHCGTPAPEPQCEGWHHC